MPRNPYTGAIDSVGLPLFDRCEQVRQIERVSSRLAELVLAFVRERRTFHMTDLNAHVRASFPTAPDSAGRILRDLRQQGRIRYRVVNRRASLYEVTKVEMGG